MLKRLLYRLYERQLVTEIRAEPLPRHIGLIQDGHRRYSRDVGLATLSDGYRIGAAVEITRGAGEWAIRA